MTGIRGITGFMFACYENRLLHEREWDGSEDEEPEEEEEDEE